MTAVSHQNSCDVRTRSGYCLPSEEGDRKDEIQAFPLHLLPFPWNFALTALGSVPVEMLDYRVWKVG